MIKNFPNMGSDLDFLSSRVTPISIQMPVSKTHYDKTVKNKK